MKRVDLEQWRAREVARLLALVETERRYYQEIVAVMPVGLAVIDKGLAFLSANRSFRNIFGVSERDLTKIRLIDLFPGGEVDSRVAEVLETGDEQRNIAVQYVTAEGPRPLRLSIQPFHGWDEEANTEVLLIVEDLEVRPVDETVTVERPDGQLLENIQAILWERDPNSLRFTSAIGRTEEILGYPAGEWTGKADFDERRIHPQDREWVNAFYRASLSSLDTRSCEYRALRADGRTVWLRDVIRVIRDAEGSPVSLTGITVDASEQKVRDEQVLQAEKIAALGRLAGKVTHDCNNLLMIVTGYSEELLDKLPADHSARGDVEEIIAAADRLSNLTAELLSFTHRPPLSPKEFSLNSLLDSFEDGIRRELGEGIELVIRQHSGLDHVNADWDRIGDAILTLAREARGAMPEGGRLTVETSNMSFADGSSRAVENLPPGHYVTLSVTDSGPVLDEETKARLFEPFFSSSRTGQDLPSVYTVVRDSGGDIRASSGPGGGTRFTIYLPALERRSTEPAPAKVEKPAPEKEAPPALETILLAEDEDGIRTLVRKILRKQGYTVLEAHNGEEALRIAQSHSQEIDLLLTDVVMLGLNGRELAERLQAGRRNIKVLYISGYTGEGLAGEGALPEGAAFLQKPFSLASLLDKVRSVLDG